jgi:LacI family transcriptional regulator
VLRSERAVGADRRETQLAVFEGPERTRTLGLRGEHLLANGHRRIAFIGRDLTLTTIQHRRDGYRAALRSAGVPPDHRLERVLDPAVGPSAALAALSEVADPPTAIFSADSQTSIALVPELHARRNRGLALVSFGDFPMAAALRPSVSVVDQDPAALGGAAAERLFTRVDHPTRRLRRQIVMPVRLQVRQSSARPRVR